MPQSIFPGTRSDIEGIIIGMNPTLPLDTQTLVDTFTGLFLPVLEVAYPSMEQAVTDKIVDVLNEVLPILGTVEAILDDIERASNIAHEGINVWAEPAYEDQ